VFLQKVRVERALEEARKEDATAGEKAELERIQEVFVAGEEALKAGEHAVAAGLFGQCEPGLEKWRKAVEERKERERAAAAAQQAEERRRLEEREARKEAERKRAEAEAAKNRADAVRAAKDLGGLVLAGLLVWGVATWWSKQAVESAVLKTKDAVVRMGRGTREGEEKTVRMGKDAEMTFVWCPAGSFSMGSHNGGNDETPVHEVRLTGFWMAKTEVTQKQWESVMGNNPSHHKGDNLPVERVSWDDCEEFCRKTGLQLPTEAEWEYACRAGTTGDYGGTGNREAMGWYSGNSGNETHPVGRKQANAWGLQDMHGNVWEWCADWYDGGYYAKSPGVNPQGPVSGEDRVLRGGSYWGDPRGCRSAGRDWFNPGDRDGNVGFRPVARQD
jgi:formylglycine-generating enzyme required for sulfatase activity